MFAIFYAALGVSVFLKNGKKLVGSKWHELFGQYEPNTVQGLYLMPVIVWTKRDGLHDT